MFDEIAIEGSIKDKFGLRLVIEKAIARQIPVGLSARATVFLTDKKQLFCFIDGPSRLLLSDVRKIASRMGLKPETFFPPTGRPDYFNDIGRDKFREVFPGRHDINPSDIAYYRTLAPYCPALFTVHEVTDGTILQADSDARTGWRPSVKFAYRRIMTS